MLSILRRHVGWGLKVILGIIIVSFVFFFGYTSLQQQSADSVALKVGKEEILFSRFQFFYNNQYESFRTKLKDGEIPEFLLKSIRQSTERTLVQRSLTQQFAQSLGITVTDQELAQFIVKNKDFDPVEYKNFLQSFYRENGFSYEALVREDLLLQKFQTWAQNAEGTAPETPDFRPQIRLVDLWFEDFASKQKIKSLIQEESQ